ncbi:MAG: aminopeptidase [Solobacterium sp.]|nr:aminopeptidase [Solobacterium sp.]
MNGITNEMLEAFRSGYENDRAAVTNTAACARSEIKDLAFLPMNAAKLNGSFSVEIETHGITAQQKSGRCWAFAVLNILREQCAEKTGMKEFYLSGNYIAFYDKLEKANNALELAIANADKPLDDRMMEYLLNGFHDGGYWNMAVDLVQKYGIVPASVMPETYQSEHTEQFMRLLNNLVRKDICILRRVCAEGIDPQPVKHAMMAEIYKMECIVFGEPVDSFDFEYRTADGAFHRDVQITPQEFYEKYTNHNLDEYVMVTCEPTEHKHMDTLHKFHYIGSMADKDICFLNIPIEEIEDLCIKQLMDMEPVWFSNDAGAYGDRQSGVWDQNSFDYEGLMGGVQFPMDKEDRLNYHVSSGTHAMILVGVNLDESGRPDRWKIENSWGGELGKNGIFVCSEAYFREYVYEAIIQKKYLTEKQLALLDTEPEVIQPWQK